MVTAEPIGGPLILRHASRHSSGTWSPDDYDVMSGDKVIGRIFRPRAGVPEDHPWMWTITGAVVAPHLPSHGFCASLDEAKVKSAETWRAWLVRNLPARHGPPSLMAKAAQGWAVRRTEEN